MTGLETLFYQTGQYAPLVAVMAAVFLGVEAFFLTVARQRRVSGQINTRLRVLSREQSHQATLIELRRARGLTDYGSGYRLPIAFFSRLVLQSGISVPIERLLVVMSAVALAAGLISYTVFIDLALAFAAALILGVILPTLLLMALRSRRQKRFEDQLPEAIEVIVRSLKAGHPITVAIAMVGREMPDPIGSEFGMASDEMTYGLDLDTAMQSMRARAGQSDLAFLAVAISIQLKTGGNLAEILANLSRLIRERAKMRRKIRALSAEGRFSAIALSIVPLVIYGIVNLTSPSYYSDVKADPVFMPAFYVGLVLWATGIFTIRRMVNFKF